MGPPCQADPHRQGMPSQTLFLDKYLFPQNSVTSAPKIAWLHPMKKKMPSWKSTIATCHAWPRAALDTNETKLVASGAKRCLRSPTFQVRSEFIYTVQYTRTILKCTNIYHYVCIWCYIIHIVFLYVIMHSWLTLCKPSWSGECLDRCISYHSLYDFMHIISYHIENA